jgi:hypothetical protein
MTLAKHDPDIEVGTGYGCPKPADQRDVVVC